ncbi:HAD family hydrolase [Noviherbaspirillum sp.]|jgi:phosphoglycolate phosphatase-like HAD superfamily hydrolase|uniref:5' nucleotidase, NT5C type n=1 Tax=Noviherbaspirillum sp. TaxID=1926288 RepID=UPI0025F2A19B|nr:HAD family hydrolase [Noviherbaspirillum sp.]
MTSTRKPVIALDGDGVLVDYHQAYRAAWAKAFGTVPAVRDPHAYWPLDRFEVRRLTGDELEQFRRCFDYAYWSSIPAIPGAVEACHALAEAGYELVCVSAIQADFQTARLQNLRDCGFPIERVIATSHADGETSPKAAVLRELQPVAFVDDYLPYLRGIPADIHAALILRQPNGSPNVGEDLCCAHSQHINLAEFADWWLKR